MTLFDLSIKNAKKQLSSYFMYAFSMAFSVSIYYIFVAMSRDYRLVTLISNDFRVDFGLQSATILINLFAIIFIFSANSFFVQRRKKEIGLYSLLGMRKYQIGAMFFIENMIIGSISLVMGLISGIFFSRLFSMILLKFLSVNGDSYIIFSASSLLKTSAVFIFLFLLAAIKSASTVYRSKLLALFNSDKPAVDIGDVTLENWILGIISLVTYGLLVEIVLKFNFIMMIGRVYFHVKIGFIFGLVVVIALGFIGTYLFYNHFLSILLCLFKQIKKRYYMDLNMLTVNQLSNRLGNSAKMMVTTTIFLGISLATVTLASVYYQYNKSLTDYSYDVDFAVSFDRFQLILDVLKRHDVQPTQTLRIDLKEVTGNFDVSLEELKMPKNMNFDVISQTEYNKARKMKPALQPLKLKNKNDVYMFIQMNQSNITYNMGYDESGNISQLGKVTLQGVYEDVLGNEDDIRKATKLLLVSDEYYQRLSADNEYSYYWINVPPGQNTKSVIDDVRREFSPKISEIGDSSNNVLSMSKKITKYHKVLDFDSQQEKQDKQYIKIGMKRPYTTFLEAKRKFIVYIAIFLGFLFMLATISMIVFRQFFILEKQRETYKILSKLGVPNKVIKKNIYLENAYVFFIPFIVAFFLMMFSLNWLYIVVPVVDLTFIRTLWFLLTILYGLFYWVTSHYAYCMIVDKNWTTF